MLFAAAAKVRQRASLESAAPTPLALILTSAQLSNELLGEIMWVKADREEVTFRFKSRLMKISLDN